jgi:hypothetical protein
VAFSSVAKKAAKGNKRQPIFHEADGEQLRSASVSGAVIAGRSGIAAFTGLCALSLEQSSLD